MIINIFCNLEAVTYFYQCFWGYYLYDQLRDNELLPVREGEDHNMLMNLST